MNVPVGRRELAIFSLVAMYTRLHVYHEPWGLVFAVPCNVVPVFILYHGDEDFGRQVFQVCLVRERFIYMCDAITQEDRSCVAVQWRFYKVQLSLEANVRRSFLILCASGHGASSNDNCGGMLAVMGQLSLVQGFGPFLLLIYGFEL